MIQLNNFEKISDLLWEIPKEYRADMRVPARVYATEDLLKDILHESAVQQLINTATLPGIVKYALAMPDIHQGYGFPIGGVAAMRMADGVISPGGVGYDINCGVRLLTSPYSHQECATYMQALIGQIQHAIPAGSDRGNMVLDKKSMDQVLKRGSLWTLEQGKANADDIEATEENGCLDNADVNEISNLAKERGKDQLGTLGSGNHFLEIQEVVEIFDVDVAKKFGLWKGQVTMMIHTGSRGLGHQVCTDYVRLMNQCMSKFHLDLPDRQLACAPFRSEEGQKYFQAMAAAANFAWANRQCITDEIRKVWKRVMGCEMNALKLLYDVAHNIAKKEKYDGEELIVHRKGATRAFPDQPVIIPGSMGTFSYVLVGTPEALKQTFGSTCHGAGRRMSRTQATKQTTYQKLCHSLEQYGVLVRAGSHSGLLEEAPEAYKDIQEVIQVVHDAGLAHKVAKLKPLAVVKG